jgi:hypothetical protein
MSKATKLQIAKLIKSTKEEIADFERSIKHAPLEAKGEFKSFVRKQKTKLRQLEELFNSGDWEFIDE